MFVPTGDGLHHLVNQGVGEGQGLGAQPCKVGDWACPGRQSPQGWLPSAVPQGAGLECNLEFHQWVMDAQVLGDGVEDKKKVEKHTIGVGRRRRGGPLYLKVFA